MFQTPTIDPTAKSPSPSPSKACCHRNTPRRRRRRSRRFRRRRRLCRRQRRRRSRVVFSSPPPFRRRFRRRSHRVSATGFDEITAFQPPYFTTIFFTAIFSPLHFYYPFPPQPFNNIFNTKKSYIKNIAKFTTTHNATHLFF